MQIPEKVGSGVEEKDAECAESMPASCNNSEAPKTATNQQIYLNVPNANYLDIQMQHLCIQVKYTFIPYGDFSPFYKATKVRLLESQSHTWCQTAGALLHYTSSTAGMHILPGVPSRFRSLINL